MMNSYYPNIIMKIKASKSICHTLPLERLKNIHTGGYPFSSHSEEDGQRNKIKFEKNEITVSEWLCLVVPWGHHVNNPPQFSFTQLRQKQSDLCMTEITGTL